MYDSHNLRADFSACFSVKLKKKERYHLNKKPCQAFPLIFWKRKGKREGLIDYRTDVLSLVHPKSKSGRKDRNLYFHIQAPTSTTSTNYFLMTLSSIRTSTKISRGGGLALWPRSMDFLTQFLLGFGGGEGWSQEEGGWPAGSLVESGETP